MLRRVTIICPFCNAETEISVSTGDGKEMHGSRSPCRACRQPILTVTLADGQIAFLKGDQLFLLQPIRKAEEEASRGRGKRHQIVPPQNLGLFDRGTAMEAPEGISDDELQSQSSVVQIDRLLWRPDGTRRSIKDVAKHYGFRSAWVAELNYNLRFRLSQPPPFSEPPAIFLSYRWGGEQHNRWVAALADKLAERGYRVTLDQLVPPNEMNVPAFVSGIADCRHFLAIIDPGYVERLGTEDSSSTVDGWVFDEVNSAFFLENQGLLRIVGLLREGTVLPNRFAFPSPGRPGNTIDVREFDLLADFLDDVFPPRRETAGAVDLTVAEQLYKASIAALARSEYQEAFDLAGKLINLAPALIDGYVQQLRVCLASGSAEAGLAVSRAALDQFSGLAELDFAAAQFALELDEFAQAARHAARVLQAPKLSKVRRGTVHAILGAALDEFDQVDAAVAHLNLAIDLLGRQPLLLRNLGLIRQRMGEPDEAAVLFTEALEADPASVPLRVNQVTALIEAGETRQAREAFTELTRVSTDRRTIAVLGEALAQFETTGVPIELVSRAPVSRGKFEIRCSSCEASLSSDESQSLCAGCGCARDADAARCPFCDADGQVPVMIRGNGPACVCPFCGKGTMSAQAKRL